MKDRSLWSLLSLLVLGSLAWYILAVAGDVLSQSVRFIVQLSTFVLAAGLLIWLLAFSWTVLERARTERERRLEARARRRLAERESDVYVVVARRDEQVHIRDMNKEASWRPAHLDQRIYANGRQLLPGALEITSWVAWQQAGRPDRVVLPAGEPIPTLAPGQAVQPELPSLVRWFDVIPAHRGDLSHLILGVRLDEFGRLVPVTISLYDLFHTIVAASSGWGKSVFVNSILAQLATCPDPVEFVLIDQQAHGLAAFKHCERLRYPLLRQPEEILSALREVYREATEKRAPLFARFDADDLAEYNRLAEPDQFLPPVVVAVDEASALLANKEIGAELKRHAWELRKFGVYQILILTSAKGTTIDTDHRQQFSSKVQLHANERTQARLLIEDALDATGFPPGRAMVDLPGQLPVVVQTPYIDKREVRALLRPASVLPSPPAPAAVSQPEPTEEEKDRLFKQRVEAGWSRNAASLEAYGRRYAGDLVQRGKRILGEI